MKKYKAVFSNVDGTLLNSERKITKLTNQAIQMIRASGIPFAIVPARSQSGIYYILKGNKFNCAIIAYSDGLILDEVGYGVAMGNALAEIRRKIRHVTLDNNHDGIYDALCKLSVI